MSLKEIILSFFENNSDDLNEEVRTIYAKKIKGKFVEHSEGIILTLSVQELEWETSAISNKYCKGFDYFLETYILIDLIEDLDVNQSEKAKIDQIIYYAEFNA